MIPLRLIEEQEGRNRRVALLFYGDTPYFRLEKDVVEGTMEVKAQPQFHGLYVLSGEGVIRFGNWEERLIPGTQYFVPADAETYTVACGSEPIVLLHYEGPKL